MGTSYTPVTVGTGVMSQSQIDAEFTKIKTALGRVLNVYGDNGTGVNALQVDLDLNSKDILNGGVGNFSNVVVDGVDLTAQVAAAAASATAAATSETNAASSASSAATSASNAASSASDAAASAAALELPDPAIADTYLRRNSANTAYEAKTVAEVQAEIAADLSNPGEIGDGGQYAAHFTCITVGDIGHTEDTITISGTSYDGNIITHSEGAVDLAGFLAHRHSDTAALGAHQVFARSRGADAAETVVQNNDVLGRLLAVGHDGTDYAFSSEISFEVDGTPGDGDMPGRIVLRAAPDGTEALQDELTVSAGLSTFHNLLNVTGNMNALANLDVGGNFTSLGIDDNGPDNTVITMESGDHYTLGVGASGVSFGGSHAAVRTGTWGSIFGTLGSGESSVANNVHINSTGGDRAIGTGDVVKAVLNEGGSGGTLTVYGQTGESAGFDITWSNPLATLAPGGTTFGNPTGGAQGAGTVNAAGLFVNGSAVAGGVNNAFSAYMGTQLIPTSTFTKLEFDSEQFDTNGDYDPTTNYRFTPTVSGKYRLSASIYFSSATAFTAGDILQLAIYKNGSIVQRSRYTINTTNEDGNIIVNSTQDANGSTDYFEVYFYHTKGSNASIGNANFTYSEFSGNYVSS